MTHVDPERLTKLDSISDKKRTYHVALHDPTEWGKVPGWAVTIVGFERWRFFVHRDPVDSTSRDYRVSEVSTGMKVPLPDSRSKKRAVVLAAKSLGEVGPKKFEKIYKLALRQLNSKKIGLGRAPEQIDEVPR